MNIKKAATDYPIQQILAERWSPYGFEDLPVSEAQMMIYSFRALTFRQERPLRAWRMTRRANSPHVTFLRTWS